MKKTKLTNEEMIYEIIEYKEREIPLALLLENYIVTPKQLEFIINAISSNQNIHFLSEDRSNCLSLPTITRIISDEEEKELLNKLYYLKKNSEDNNKSSDEYNHIFKTLISNNLGLVNWTIENFFDGIDFSLEDAQMIGVEGLMNAINGYSPNKYPFFQSCIVGYIIRHIQQNFVDLTNIEWKDYKNKTNIDYLTQILKERKKVKATPYQLSKFEELSFMSPQLISEYQNMISGELPFSSIYKTEEVTNSKYDLPMTFEDYSEIDEYEDQIQLEYENHEDSVLQSLMSRSINEVLDTLFFREKDILIRRFGLNGVKPQSLEEIGYSYCLSRERIRTLEVKGIRQLRHPKRSRKLRDFYGTKTSYPKHKLTISKEEIYSKLFTLLKLQIEKDSILTFMNMDGLNWEIKDLNENLKKLKSIIECIVDGQQREFNVIEIINLVQKKENIVISIEFIEKIIKEYEKKEIPYSLIKKSQKKM